MSDLTNNSESIFQPGIIGIVGGVGPLAGLDLQHKIIARTPAVRDQEHLPVISLSMPGEIPDRTAFLLGNEPLNPAYSIIDQLYLLAEMGAMVAGIPCNTAHAPAIFDVIRAGAADFDKPLRLLHMIDETVAYLHANHPDLKTIGVLSTTGTWQTRLYPEALEPHGLRVIVPDETLQAVVQAAIYDPNYGIKGCGRVTEQARQDLAGAMVALHEQEAAAVILGCTELPLAFPDPVWQGIPLVDPTWVLAGALVRAAGGQPV